MNPPDDGVRAVEAVLFATEAPLTLDAIRAHVGDGVDVRGALAALEADYAGRGIELVRRCERWHFQTAGDMAHVLRPDREAARTLPRAGSQTLALNAYPAPVARPQNR